jgi:epoxyqueuosine reductase
LKQKQTILVKQLAAELGFDFCGIAKAVKLDEDAKRLESWLNKGDAWQHALYGKIF